MIDYYIRNFESDSCTSEITDILIIGAGLAGLYTALMLPSYLKIVVISKGDNINKTNSYYAQGGIAAAIDLVNDSPEKHYKDTLVCGKYTNTSKAVLTLVKEAEKNINQLIDLGVEFDKDEYNKFRLAKEGGHSLNRILHIGGDQTGALLMETLYNEVKSRNNITLLENIFVIDLLTKDNQCFGVVLDDNGASKIYYSLKTILATGGIGHLYNRTTNAEGMQGDGISMAIRAGAMVKDLDKIQFHPTAFYNVNGTNDLNRNFLISEAVRGEGARLLNQNHERLMEKVHPMKDLAPRDIVSKAIYNELKKQTNPYVYLDITHKPKEELQNRFPSIFKYCLEQGIDISKDYIPVAPVAHYYMGGIAVNINGKTSLKNLFAVGECACTGVHGDNRLASNSLLEAIVFGNRVAKYIQDTIILTDERIYFSIVSNKADITIDLSLDEKIKEWMMNYCSIGRTKKGLLEGHMLLENYYKQYFNKAVSSNEEIAIINKLTLAYTIIKYAIEHKQEVNIC